MLLLSLPLLLPLLLLLLSLPLLLLLLSLLCSYSGIDGAECALFQTPPIAKRRARKQ